MNALQISSSCDLRALFEELVELAPETRDRALAALDLPESTRAKLRALLDADAHVPSLLRTTAADAIAQLCDDDEDADETPMGSPVGGFIGSFRVLELVGEGGSSIVYRAERPVSDGTQQVALKLLRMGIGSTEARRRFRREQAILAQLTHPNIARLIDAGVSEQGIPYIAMELVAGAPITQAANARHLNVEQRLAWFYTLCRTIEAAHAALIVHRDLKPSNLFITREGDLKVLDFGIAKLLDNADGATWTKTVALTPEYAAPEQFGPERATTAVDVYALGVVLGELLTGNRLTGDTRASRSVSTRNEDEGDLPRGLPPRGQLARRLRGDLDAILANALADDPARRYRSAGALADDIERYLSAKPVRAHPPSRWYRLRKFIVRHRGGVAATSILLFGIVCSLAIAVVQSVNAQRAAHVAQSQLARADSMRDFMFAAFSEVEPNVPRSKPATVIEVVNRAITTATNDRAMDPRARTELLMRLAEAIGAQGDIERSAVLLSDAHSQAIKTLGRNDPIAFEAARLVEHNNLLRGDFKLARTQADALLAQAPASMIELRSKVLIDSAVTASKIRDGDRALTDARSAVGLSRTAGNAELLRQAQSTLGAILLSVGALPEAISVYEDVLAQSLDRFGDTSPQVSEDLAGLARAYRRAGNLERSVDFARRALSVDRAIYPSDHWITANHLNALALALLAKRDLDGALAAQRESLRISEAILGADHPETATALQATAAIEIQLEDYADALPRLRRSLALSAQQYGDHHWQTTYDRADYGYALAMSGASTAGIGELERAIADLRALDSPDPNLLARTIEKRLRVALNLDESSSVLQWSDALADASGRATEQVKYWTGRSDCLRGEVFLALKRPADASVSLSKCGAAIDAAPDADPVLRVQQRLLQAAAIASVGESERGRIVADEGRDLLKALPYPPSRLLRLERSLPR